MRIIYDYPEDAKNGDVFVVDDIDISPTTVVIKLRQFIPPADRKAEADSAALEVADRLVKEMVRTRPPGGGVYSGTIQLLVAAYIGTGRVGPS